MQTVVFANVSGLLRREKSMERFAAALLLVLISVVLSSAAESLTPARLGFGKLKVLCRMAAPR
jgi:hypothetical protein